MFCTSQEIVWANHIQNHLYCFEQNVKPYAAQPDCQHSVILPHLSEKITQCGLGSVVE